jgi:arsenical pump membrane protein
VFVFGIFVVAMGLRRAGLTHKIAAMITWLGGTEITSLSYVTSFVAAGWSSIMNNHPTADTMAWVIQDFRLPHIETRMLVFSALVGGDLGPKMLPIGSLAALLWFRILRNKGVHVPYSLYIKVGVPVTLAAIVMSIMTLNVELWVYRLFLE